MTSEAESEITGTVNNTKEEFNIGPYLFAFGHEQYATPPKTENFNTDSFVNSGMI